MNLIRWSQAGLVAVLCAGCGRPPAEAPRTAVAERGAIRMSVPFQGELETRRMELIAVRVEGSAVLTELIPDGTAVAAGDVIARFDASQIEQDWARYEHEWIRAREEWESLEKAELPLEELEWAAKEDEARSAVEAEERFLQTTRELQERGLMSESEVAQQERTVADRRRALEQVRRRADLIRRHVHTARRAKARAAVAAAERQRDFLARQRDWCTVRAPAAGIVRHVPLAVGREYRPAHVGDTLYYNQVFLCLPDPGEHVIRGYIREAELPWIRPGCPVTAAPAAFPHVRLNGRVESVGGLAQSRPDRPFNEKYFSVVIALDPLPEPLPLGISVRAEILAGEKAEAILIPREAVYWREGRAFVQTAAGVEKPVATGLADATRLEITEGLAAGEEVLLP